jgi:hypothetical protein
MSILYLRDDLVLISWIALDAIDMHFAAALSYFITIMQFFRMYHASMLCNFYLVSMPSHRYIRYAKNFTLRFYSVSRFHSIDLLLFIAELILYRDTGHLAAGRLIYATLPISPFQLLSLWASRRCIASRTPRQAKLKPDFAIAARFRFDCRCWLLDYFDSMRFISWAISVPFLYYLFSYAALHLRFVRPPFTFPTSFLESTVHKAILDSLSYWFTL